MANEGFAYGLTKTYWYRIANQSSQQAEPHRSARWHELVVEREGLKHCGLTQCYCPMLRWMSEAPVSVTEALRSYCRRRLIPLHASVNARIRFARSSSVTLCSQ